jgi:hypothetical protein
MTLHAGRPAFRTQLAEGVKRCSPVIPTGAERSEA